MTDQEIQKEQKKIKSNKLINGVLIGILIGVSVYSVVKNGVGFFTFSPLLLAYLLFYNRKKMRP